MSLHSISNDVLHLIAKINEEDFDITQYEIAESDFKDKLDHCVLAYHNLMAQASAAKEESKRIADIQKSYEGEADKLKYYIDFCMSKLGMMEHKSSVCKVSYRKSESIEVIDQDLVPDQYLVTKTSVSVDKALAKSAIKAGGSIPGIEIMSNANIQIK